MSRRILQQYFYSSVALVSFESASRLIEEERSRDDSDFVEGGVDPGRTVRNFIYDGESIEDIGTVQLCGITQILDRGLKYLSTGEIRRTLLCQALISRPSLLILDEPFEGLDTHSRSIMVTLFERMTADIVMGIAGERPETTLLLLMDRYENIPKSINRILELSARRISYSGTRESYEKELSSREAETCNCKTEALAGLRESLFDAMKQGNYTLSESTRTKVQVLVEMKGVNVEWSGKKVLENLNWKLIKGEHWLIRGPNGSGKTTFLELITGDNPQVFSNDISLFGIKRGSGETIWELKEKMGIVSYRLHVEYRILGALNLEEVVLSGLHDSIGLYQHCGEEEYLLAGKWLALAGFDRRNKELFRTLSYGEQRAILIARAAVKCPPILILDEPCHGLDDKHRALVLSLLEEIAKGGTSTLLHVTHDPSEVLPCEKHILELRPGEIPMYRILTK